MTKKAYNGWYNYETWLVALHIDNDQDTAAELYDMAKKSTGDTDTRDYGLSLAVKAWVTEELIPDMPHGLVQDLINATLAEVNWREIAHNAITEVEEVVDTIEGGY